MNDARLARIAKEVARAEAASESPRYRQVIDAMVRAIEHGTLTPGDRLPREVKLAEFFAVSPGTVQKALAHLADSGFVERTRRRGTFVAGRQSGKLGEIVSGAFADMLVVVKNAL